MMPALQQLLPSAALVLGTTSLGMAATVRLWTSTSTPVATRLAVGILMGLGTFGLALLGLGHVGLIGPWVPAALCVAGAALAVMRRAELRALAAEAASGLLRQWRRSPIPIAAVGAALLLASVAAMAPPFRTDEVEYHWPAAVQWAEAGRWIDSDYRHVDGFPFMEILYTGAATWGSYGAAHMLHLLTLVALGLGVSGAATSIGIRGSAATGTAAMAAPVVWDGAYVAYNDTAVGAFATCAVAVVLGSRPGSRTAIVVAAALLAGAISSKPTATAAVGLLGLVLLMQRIAPPSHRWSLETRQMLRGWVVLGVTAFATLGFWSLRQRLITGSFVDPALTGPPSAEALSRLPDTTDRLVAPVMPLVTGILGSLEPWGGRTSVVLQVFLLPALLIVLVRRGVLLRRFGLLAAPAWAHWVVLGLVGVRTRFHVVVWALLTVSVRLVVEDLGRGRPRRRRLLEIAWGLCVVMSVIDVSLEMVRLIGAEVL